MHQIKKLFIITLFASSISLLNLTAYAGPGGGHGGGQGNGMGHGGQGNSMGHGGGQGNSMGHSSGQGHSMGHGNSTHAKSTNAVANKTIGQKNLTRFSNTDRKAITNYYAKNPLPATALPPGIAMNLARGKPLPPGIAKRYLAPDLLSTLPVRPGYEYIAVGKDVALVNSSTGIVSDILANVFK